MKYFYGLNIPIRRVTSNVMHTIHQVIPKLGEYYYHLQVRKIGFSLQVYYKGAFILGEKFKCLNCNHEDNAGYVVVDPEPIFLTQVMKKYLEENLFKYYSSKDKILNEEE